MDTRIEMAVSEMDRRLPEPLTVEELARVAQLSPSRFAHLFRLEVGVPPMRYLQERRMARASLLLARTFLSIKQVMAHVGYNDPSHFARDFRRYHGKPPREWRAEIARGPGTQDHPETVPGKPESLFPSLAGGGLRASIGPTGQIVGPINAA
jgi:AraC-like DNA-binding protein